MSKLPSMGRRPRKQTDEYDAFSRYWRSRIASFDKPGTRSKIKRRVRRRERHEAKLAARRGVD